MKILSVSQIKAVDAYTIEHEPISSPDLMDRAARTCVKNLYGLIHYDDSVLVICGTGNNGGDGFAIARILLENNYTCKVCLIPVSEKMSPDAEVHYLLLKHQFPQHLQTINQVEELEFIAGHYTVLLDALFGIGLNKPVYGLAAEIIQCVNAHFKRIISIDIPSGMFADEHMEADGLMVQSSFILTFQTPKLPFMLPQYAAYVPAFKVLDIGLHPDAIDRQPSPYHYITPVMIKQLLKKRHPFSHKGMYGHALLIAGSKGKGGAALIAAKACLRSGAGLLTVHSTTNITQALLTYLPEAMSESDPNTDCVSEIHKPEKYDAIAFGPGIGTGEESAAVLKKILHTYAGRLVVDADGLNILSENKTWLEFLPPDTILTPHPGEFERLTHKHNNDLDRLKTLQHFSQKHRCIVILKGAFSAIAMPDGNVFFNSSGNPGLAKGGSGDALTGIILGLLSRGYNAPQASMIATFVHGMAADLCVKKNSMESLLISDVIEMLPKAFSKLETK